MNYFPLVSPKVAFLILSLLTFSASMVQASGFPTIPSYKVGPFPAALASGDFNGDGKLDLVVSNECQPAPCPNAITLSRGNGNGSFQSPVTISKTAGGGRILAADFNGDHKLDFVVFNTAAGSLSVFKGNGNGTFQAPVNIALAPQTFQFAIGDFNGDGRLDIVDETNSGQNYSFEVRIGNGDGTFQPPVSTPTLFQTGLGGIAVGDFNRDGKLDVAAISFTSTTNVVVQLGNGNGTFQAPNTIVLPNLQGPILAADLNNDGKIDLAVTTDTQVDVLYGNGDSTFQVPVKHFTGQGEDGLLIGDFNGDGKPDLLALSEADGSVSVLLNKGANSIPLSAIYLAPLGRAPVVADFNGDGKSDLVFLTLESTNVFVELAAAKGTLSAPECFVPQGNRPTSMAAGDLNNDAKLDVVVASTKNGTAVVGELTSMLGVGNGTFGAPSGFFSGGKGSNFLVVAGDLNRDGKLDAVLVNTGTSNISVLLGLGNGKFQSAVNYAVSLDPSTAEIGDFNNDGIPDLVVWGRALGNGTILLGNGDGTFRAGPNLPGGIVSLAVGDFNRDGKLDLAITNNSGTGVMLGNGDGTFRPVSNLRTGAGLALLVADFNGDGKLDVAGFACSLTVYRGNGDGTLQAGITTSLGTTCVDGGVPADFNGDGKIDLALTAQNSLIAGRSFAILSGNGDGTFQAPHLFPVGNSINDLVAGDFDGDGTTDLVAVISDSNYFTILLNKP